MMDEIIDKNVTVVASTSTEIKYKCNVPINTQNGYKTVHGGFTFSLFENLSRRALIFYNSKIQNNNLVTIKASTNYLESITPGSNIIVEININKSSKNLFVVAIFTYSEDYPQKILNSSNNILKINNHKF